MPLNQKWILSRVATGMYSPDVFRLEESPIAAPKDGEVVVRVRMISLDPILRVLIGPPTPDEDEPYVNPGDVMFGFGVGDVIESCASGIEVGDVVDGRMGWQTYATMPATAVIKRNPAYKPEDLLGVIGITGMSAYLGMHNVMAPAAGQTVVVSGAAGAVGTVAGQIAKIMGCKTVGIAGGPRKCERLVKELGLDGAVDYKATDWQEQLREACPEGIDLFFDTVGGEVLINVALQMKLGGRIGISGATSVYNEEEPKFGLRRLFVTVIVRDLILKGFTLIHFDQKGKEQAEERMLGWMRDGRLKAPTEVREGFEKLPAALLAQFKGENWGKLMVRIP